MAASSPTRRTRPLWVLLAATVLCYLIGYPLALIGHSDAGWIFVGLGGPFLIALGVMTIRHLNIGMRTAPRDVEPPASASPR